MKAKHRHDLETNWLAKKLAEWIETARPYGSAALGIAVVLAAGVLGFSYFSGSTSARQREAWASFNEAIGGRTPDLEQLRLAAEQYAGTTMQQWADVTWADGQVLRAASGYVYDRAGALELLGQAAGMYRNLLEDSDDERLKSRAHFGLGRVYELRGELDTARDEYLAVSGGFEELAKHRIEELNEPKTQETYNWLATAQAPRRTTPTGPGTPGQRPEFSAGGIDIPPEGESAAEGAAASIEDLFGGFAVPDVPEDRYDAEGESGDDAEATDGDSAADATADTSAAAPPDEPVGDE